MLLVDQRGLKIDHDIYHEEVIDYLDSGNLSEVMKWKSDFNGLNREREKRKGTQNTHNSFKEFFCKRKQRNRTVDGRRCVFKPTPWRHILYTI